MKTPSIDPAFRADGTLLPAAPRPKPLLQPFFLQKIPAGFPSPATDYTEATLDLNDYLVTHKAASFFFRVVGLSMINAHIDDGDIVLVDRAVEAHHGHIVLAVVDSEYTIKRLYNRSGVIELRPDNPSFAPIRFQDGSQLELWGLVTAVIRKLT